MKILIAYFRDEEETSENISDAEFFYTAHSIESAEENLGKVEREIKKRNRVITDADTDF